MKQLWYGITQAVAYLATYYPDSMRLLSKRAKAELNRLQKTNKTYRQYRYGFTYRAISFLDAHRIVFVVSLLVSCAICVVIWNLSPFIWTFSNGETKTLGFDWLAPGRTTTAGSLEVTTGDNYHSFIGTVQATVFALIIPITVALHEFVVKGRRLKEDIIDFIFKESRVRLIIWSSLGLLIWVTIVEALKIIFDDFHLSRGSTSIEAGWLVLNLGLIGYFTFTALNLVNRSQLNMAMRRFIVNEIYPRELQGYLERNIFLNKSTRENESDDE